jgi:hypothetical protein
VYEEFWNCKYISTNKNAKSGRITIFNKGCSCLEVSYNISNCILLIYYSSNPMFLLIANMAYKIISLDRRGQALEIPGSLGSHIPRQ